MMANKKLITFRKDKKLLQKEMYVLIGVSKSYYEKVEYGILNAGKGFIKKMINAFPEDKEEILNIFF